MNHVKNILKIALVLTLLVVGAANAARVSKPGWGSSSATTSSK
jgi:hypothetical protein